MKIITTPKGNEIRYFANSKEGSMSRYNEHNKWLLLESGVGSDMNAINGHFSKLFAFIASNKTVDIKGEAENLFFTHYAILEKINFYGYAFACLIHSIDGTEYTDFTEDGLKVVIAILEQSGISQEEIENAVEDVKKKIIDDLRLFFPAIFPPDDSYAFYQSIKRQIALLGGLLLQEEKNAEDIQELTRLRLELITGNKPQNFRPNDPDNILISYDKSYAALMSMAEQNGTHNPGSLSPFDFYARVDFLRRRYSK